MANRRLFSWIFFTDLLFNLVIGLVTLFFLSLLLINPITEDKKIDSKAEFIVMMTWPEKSNADVDLWVEMPDGEVVGYQQKQNSVVTLERDDIGLVTDTHTDRRGNLVFNPINREIITVRGIIEGEWTANIHYFASRPIPKDHVSGWVDNPPVTHDKRIPVLVEVQVIKLNPIYRVIATKKVLLTFQKEERTMARFVLDEYGDFVEHIDIPKKIVPISSTANIGEGD